MFDGLKKLFGSGTFWLTIVGTVVYAVLIQIGLTDEQALSVLGLFGLNTVQRLSKDFGKEAAVAEARAAITDSVIGMSPAERAAAMEAAALDDDPDDG